MLLKMLDGHVEGAMQTPWMRLLSAVLVLALLWTQLGVAYGQGASSGGEGGGIAITECDRNQCFASVQARQSHAQRNNCYFLEDVCTDFDREAGNRAQEEDRGFWGSLWDAGVGAIQYGYEFIKGLFAGLGDQIKDLIDLVSDPVETVKGLVELGKQFYEDPAGTIQSLAKVLGQEAVNAIVRATQCGAYDLGRVIGQHVNPVVMVRLGTQLARFGGKLDDAVAATRRDLGCASFVAGTPVWLADGLGPIERMRVGQQVLSRDEKTWADAPQSITQVFGRTAPGVWELVTEHESYRLTEEHPVWVQGKGWTQAKDIREDDVLASARGDALVRANTLISQPTPVYNFSVANTPNYFVGENGLWVHNAACDIPLPYRVPKSPSNYQVGASDGGPGSWVNITREDNAHFRYEKQVTGAPRNVEYEVNGKKFDGYDAQRNVLIDAKDYGPNNPLVKGEPQFLADQFRADALADARGQVGAAGGAKVEWHVATQDAANKLNDLFESDPGLSGKISVVWNPGL